MRDVKLHAALLLVAGVWALQTWTREEPATSERERPLVWERDTAEVIALTYRSDRREVRVSRRSEGGDTYLWGEEIVRGSGAARQAGPDAPDTQEPQATADTLLYPLGAAGSRLVAGLAELRVLRDLGAPDEARRSELGLVEPDAVIAVEFDDGTRTIQLGDEVFGAQHRYAWSPEQGRAFVLPSEVVLPLASGSGALRVRRLHDFGDADVATARVRAGGQERVMRRRSATGGPATWTPPDAPDESDPAFADFMERVGQLAIQDFEVEPDLRALDVLLRVDYLDEEGDPLGFIELYGDPSDPAGDLYVRSEQTRVVARAVKLLADRVAEEIAALF